MMPSLLGGSWGHVGLFFRNFSNFFHIFGLSSLMLVFFIVFFLFLLDFWWFGEGFGRILKRFFDDFLNYLGKMRFCKKCCFTVGKPQFLRVRIVKNNEKIMEKSMQI